MLKIIPEWDSFTTTSINNSHGITISGLVNLCQHVKRKLI